MKIGNATDPMVRFLEAKKAAELRMNGVKSATDVSKPGIANSPEAFLNLLAEIRGKNPAATASKTETSLSAISSLKGNRPVMSTEKLTVMEAAKGLLSVYNINRALGSHLTESSSADMVQQNRHLGSLFDSVA